MSTHFPGRGLHDTHSTQPLLSAHTVGPYYRPILSARFPIQGPHSIPHHFGAIRRLTDHPSHQPVVASQIIDWRGGQGPGAAPGTAACFGFAGEERVTCMVARSTGLITSCSKCVRFWTVEEGGEGGACRLLLCKVMIRKRWNAHTVLAWLRHAALAPGVVP